MQEFYEEKADALHEECGVFGIFSPEKERIAPIVYHGLYALQHRGQESCGMVINHDGLFSSHKNLGLVGEVFTPEVMQALPEGQIGVGHVRYATTGDAKIANCQPLEINHRKGHLALAHNGNLSNAYALRDRLELGGAIFHTTSDTEIIAYMITQKRLRFPSIEEAALAAMQELEGAYSLILMSPTKMITLRDPHGFRPLCYGRLPSGAWVASSESCALDAVGATFIRELLPGELVVFSSAGMQSYRKYCATTPETFCSFEYIYFARPDSHLFGLSVHDVRRQAGILLHERHPVDADLVIGAPDSGLDAALGFAEASGIPYRIGLIKNKYIGRTFIEPGQDHRSDQVRIKLNPIRSVIAGKRIVLVDDSIVRGTTSRQLIRLLREAGAKEIHMRISSPPFISPCYYGTDIDSKEHLIATGRSLQEMAAYIEADSLGFLDPEDLQTMLVRAGRGNDHTCAREDAALSACPGLCRACFTEDYPTSIPAGTRKNRFENPLDSI